MAAPLLAGFALTLLGLVLQIDKQLRWPDPVLVLLSLAFVLFLQVVQLNARAKGYAVTPTQVREWYADAETPARQELISRELRHHQQCWHLLVTRARNRYNLGIVTLLIGAALMLVPRDPGALTGVRVTALVVLCAGVALELLELLGHRLTGGTAGAGQRGNLLGRIVGSVVPPDPPVPAPPVFPAVPTSPPPVFPAVPGQPTPPGFQSVPGQPTPPPNWQSPAGT